VINNSSVVVATHQVVQTPIQHSLGVYDFLKCYKNKGVICSCSKLLKLTLHLYTLSIALHQMAKHIHQIHKFTHQHFIQKNSTNGVFLSLNCLSSTSMTELAVLTAILLLYGEDVHAVNPLTHSILNSLEFKGGLAVSLTIFTTFFVTFSNQFLCS